jgi:hypothetical protein
MASVVLPDWINGIDKFAVTLACPRSHFETVLHRSRSDGGKFWREFAKDVSTFFGIQFGYSPLVRLLYSHCPSSTFTCGFSSVMSDEQLREVHFRTICFRGLQFCIEPARFDSEGKSRAQRKYAEAAALSIELTYSSSTTDAARHEGQ